MTPGPAFRVLFTAHGRSQVRLLLRTAHGSGFWDRVAGAMREVERELGQRPRDWGDPVVHYPAANLTLFRRVHDELAVVYAVHDQQPVLWITDVTPVLGHPLRE